MQPNSVVAKVVLAWNLNSIFCMTPRSFIRIRSIGNARRRQPVAYFDTNADFPGIRSTGDPRLDLARVLNAPRR